MGNKYDTGGRCMAIKRTKKRKLNEPRTTVPDFGISKILSKIDKAISLLDKRTK